MADKSSKAKNIAVVNRSCPDGARSASRFATFTTSESDEQLYWRLHRLMGLVQRRVGAKYLQPEHFPEIVTEAVKAIRSRPDVYGDGSGRKEAVTMSLLMRISSRFAWRENIRCSRERSLNEILELGVNEPGFLEVEDAVVMRDLLRVLAESGIEPRYIDLVIRQIIWRESSEEVCRFLSAKYGLHVTQMRLAQWRHRQYQRIGEILTANGFFAGAVTA